MGAPDLAAVARVYASLLSGARVERTSEGLRASGQRRGVMLSVHLVVDEDGDLCVELTAPVATRGMVARLVPHNEVLISGAVLSASDPRIAERYRLAGAPAAAVTEIFDPEAQAALAAFEAHRQFGLLGTEVSHDRLVMRSSCFERREAIEAFLDAAAAIASRAARAFTRHAGHAGTLEAHPEVVAMRAHAAEKRRWVLIALGVAIGGPMLLGLLIAIVAAIVFFAGDIRLRF